MKFKLKTGPIIYQLINFYSLLIKDRINIEYYKKILKAL